MDNYSDEFYQFRSLTDDFVFCPKCGTKNIFRLSRTGTQLNYFCERCSEKLNDYWEGAFAGQLSVAMCKACQQSTFEELKYCVSCGSIQGKVARKRAREISKHLPDGGTDKAEKALLLLDCCTYRPIGCCPCGFLFGFFASLFLSVLKSRPKSFIYISLAITSIITILFIVLWL